MKSLLICITIILLLTSPVIANASLERNTSVEADGRINVSSIVGNKDTQSGVTVKGDGEMDYNVDVSLSEDETHKRATIETITDDETLRPVQTIVATKTGDESLEFVYALLTEPSRGEASFVDYEIMVASIFGDISVGAEASVTQGVFRNYVRLWYLEDEISLEEAMYIIGYTYYMDMLTFSIPEEEE